MHYVEFDAIVQAIAELRTLLPSATGQQREQLIDALGSLRQLANQALDAWMELDELIEQTYADLSLSEQTANGVSWFSGMAMADDLAAWQFSEACELRKGLAYYDLHMFEQAARSLGKAVAQEGDESAGLRIYLALSHLANGRLAEAETMLLEAATRVADVIERQAVLEVGVQLAATKGDWQSAIDQLFDLLDTDADKADTWYNLGVCHLRLRQWAFAQRCFARAYQRREELESLLGLALATLLAGDREGAGDLCSQVATASVESARLVQLLSSLLIAAGRRQDAITLARRCLHDPSVAATGYYLLGLCAFADGEIGRASSFCKQCLTLERNRDDAAMMLAVCAYLQGGEARAEAIMQGQLMRRNQFPPVVSLLAGRLAMRRGRIEEAEMFFEQVVASPHATSRMLARRYQQMLAREKEPLVGEGSAKQQSVPIR
ncbi:hypothetical protein GCM10025858_01840 [Alicyclobacillus sacchari]|uniref:tetratricopeptide repeat protein n=1 Tax=Alicyclobacillus sacchari TaxID=392010 RepID=UPI00141701D7|nr:tetratricopeptide repeat protein [Alicyclobacillus sacchari]GMA55681.1 hypothetical protein GCM10025858_01840 [Alicyclobacillus sacchari]